MASLTNRFDEHTRPSADEAAKAVLATCMADPLAAERAVDLLTPEDFLEAADGGEMYAPIFKAITSLVQRGKRPAPVLVDQEMKALGIALETTFIHINSTKLLMEMAQSYSVGVAVDEYVQIMRLYGARRMIRLAGLELKDLSTQENLTVEELLAQAEATLSKARAVKAAASEPVRLGDVIRQRVEMHKARKRGEFPGLRTGFRDVDYILRGMQDGDFIVVAARPSMGKTAIAQQIGLYNAEKQGKRVLLISAEQPGEQLADRAIASEGGVDGGLLRAALVEPAHWNSVDRNLITSGVLDANFYVEDRINMVNQIRMLAQRMNRTTGLDLLLIDHLQHLKGSGTYKGQRVQEMGEISRGIKDMAKELKIPIIALSQLSRAVEARQDKRPILSDLRETGDIEQDADVVGFLYRDDYYNPETSTKPGTAEFNILKNRNGPLGMAELGFIKTRTRFEDLEQRRG